MIIFFLLNYAYSQVVKCPDGWVKTSGAACLRTFTEKLSWNAAESKCQTFGGDLVSIGSQQEQDDLLFMLDRNHYDYFWIGLTDYEQMGTYKWTKTDGTECSYAFKWWAKGMPNDNDNARCTYMLFSDHLPGDDDNGQLGRWVKGKCTNAYKFVCKTLLSNFPDQCSDNFVYKKEADKCYKVGNSKNSWSDTELKCENAGGNLANIRSEVEQTAISSIIPKKDARDGYWIGLTDHYTKGTMTWIINQDIPSYQNWAYGEPSDQTLASYPGGTCGFIDHTTGADVWATGKCGDMDSKGYVCEHEPGKTCPPGWTYFKSDKNTESCLFFVVNGHEHLQWWSARQYCDSIGADIFLPTTEAEQINLAKYYSDWGAAGITRMWIGAEAKDAECSFTTWDGRSLYYEGWESGEPRCDTAQNDDSPFCVYMNTLATGRNWHVGDCYDREAFACQVRVGQKVHEKPVENQSDYYCTQDDEYKDSLQFKLYEDDVIGPKCFMFLRDVGAVSGTSVEYKDAVKKCASLGGELATIHSAEQNAWINSHTNKNDMWLGASHIKGQVPAQWDNGETMDFVAFEEKQPRPDYDKNGDNDCAIIRHNIEAMGHWVTRACTMTRRPICEKNAVKGHAPKPTPTPNPEFSKCEEGWFHVYSTGNCYYIDHFFSSTWDVAEAHCNGKAAHLMSINDPKTQELILTFANDPDAIGNSLFYRPLD